MYNPTPPSEVLPQRTIQIPSKEVIPRVQPAISIGEVLRMVVRSNDQGQGQLYFRGLLIPAVLPETLAPGDKIFAKVTQANDQLVLKLLETHKQADTTEEAALAEPAVAAQASIADDFEMLLKEVTGPALFADKALPLPAAAEQPEDPVGNALQKIFTALLSDEALTDPKQAQAQLQDAATGKVPAALRDTADQLKKLLVQSDPADSNRFLGALKQELSDLVENSVKDNRAAKDQIQQLIDSLNDEIKLVKHGPQKDKQIMQQTLQELKTAKDSPQKTIENLETSLNRLRDALSQSGNKPLSLDAHTKGELGQIAARLEQLANTQENLNHLNPVMQALGEPALILLPFLAQGLLTQSQVSIQTPLDREGNSSGSRGRESSQDESGEADNAPYQRIQVSVPLPSMGMVHVDIAHRKDEILVRFNVTEPEAGRFLVDQLEHLTTTLRSLNFATTELSAHVGPAPDVVPEWAQQGGDSVIA